MPTTTTPNPYEMTGCEMIEATDSYRRQARDGKMTEAEAREAIRATLYRFQHGRVAPRGPSALAAAIDDPAEAEPAPRLGLAALSDDPVDEQAAADDRLAGVVAHLGWQDKTDILGAGGYVSTVGCRCQVTNRDAYEVAFVPIDEEGDLQDVRRAFDKADADAYHAELVAKFQGRSSNPKAVGDGDEYHPEGTKPWPVSGLAVTFVPVAFATLLAMVSFAAGQQDVGAHVQTEDAARKARHAFHVETAVYDAEQGYEGRVTAPAGVPRAARPFCEEVA